MVFYEDLLHIRWNWYKNLRCFLKFIFKGRFSGVLTDLRCGWLFSWNKHCTINPNEIPDTCTAHAINNSFRKHYGHRRSPKLAISIHCLRLIFPARRAGIIIYLFFLRCLWRWSKGKLKDVAWISTHPSRENDDVCFHARPLFHFPIIRWPYSEKTYKFLSRIIIREAF